VKHGALIDAQLLAQVYVELTGGRQIGLSLTDLIAATEEPLLAAAETAPIRITIRPPRPHAPSQEEIAAHAKFLGGIADPIWHRLDGRG
jgi:DNA polymerase-3 subunit epsilon